MTIRRFLGLLMILFGVTGTASASIIVTTGTDNTGTANVLANGCTGANPGPAFTISGCLNTNQSYLVNFTSDELIQYSGGQATIVDAGGNGFSRLTISLAAATDTFSKLLLNIDASTNGTVTFSGVPGGTSGTFNLDASGENKFIITGENFTSVSFITSVGVELDIAADVKQVRIGVEGQPTDVTATPEPASLLLLGTGLFGVAAGTRRRFCKQ